MGMAWGGCPPAREGFAGCPDPLDAGPHLELQVADVPLGDAAAGRHAVGEPDVAPDGRALPDDHPAQDGGPGVDDDVVLDDGVAVDALDGIPLLVEGEALGPQGDALVDAHV